MKNLIDMKNNLLDSRQGMMYFLVFLGVNFIFQKLFPFIFENILKVILIIYPGYNLSILFENLISYAVYLILMIAAIFFSIYSLRNYMRGENSGSVVNSATILYGIYLLVFQVIMVWGELIVSNSGGNMQLFLQVIFILINILVFYILSKRYLKVKT